MQPNVEDPLNVSMVPAEQTLHVTMDPTEQQNLQSKCAIFLQSVLTPGMSSHDRDFVASGSSLPMDHQDKQPKNLQEVQATDNCIEPVEADANATMGDSISSLQVNKPDKGKADVPIPHIGSSHTANPKGNYGSFSLPGSPSLLTLHSLAQEHALQIIDGAHLISEEGLDLWIQHFASAT